MKPVFAVSAPMVEEPKSALFAKRFVDDAVVANDAVEVAFVIMLKTAANLVEVALRAFRFVEEAVVVKKVVEVALVSVTLPVNELVPEKVLELERSVVEAPRAARVPS